MNIKPKSTTAETSVPVVNIRERYSDRYKIQHEESFHALHPKPTGDEELALLILPCKHGHIFPWGGERLAASTDHSGKIANELRALAKVSIEQDGSDGVTVSFDVNDFEAVAEIMKPKRQRRLSEESRAALIESGKDHRFGKSTGQTKVFRGQVSSKSFKSIPNPFEATKTKSTSQDEL